MESKLSSSINRVIIFFQMLFMSEHFAWIETANGIVLVPPLTNHIASKLLRNGGAFYLNGDLDIIGGPLFISFLFGGLK